MPTKRAVSRTQAVRDYLNAHPGAVASEIVAALDKRGIKVTLNHVATIKMMTDAATKAAAEIAAPREKPADTLTFDQVKMVAQAIKRIRLRKAANP